MLNLAVLLVGMRFLLYKPVKKIIEKRKALYDDAEKSKNQMLTEAEQWKAGYGEMLEKAHAEEAAIKNDAVKAAEAEGKVIVDKAKQEAAEIVEKANRDAKAQRQQLKEDLSHNVPELAVNIASKLLKRELTTDDNDKLIDSVIQNWKDE